MTRRYTDEEARAILGRAFAAEAAQNGRLHHEDLVEAAREMGLSPDSIEAAASEVAIDSEAQRNVDTRRRIKKQKFFRGLIRFLIVNATLFGIDMLTPGGPWFPYVLLIWGAFVALRASKVFVPPSEEENLRELAKERHRLQLHYTRAAEQRARDERRKNRKGAEQILEENIERGVNRLLEMAAKGIGNLTPSPPSRNSGSKRPPAGGFGDYVAGRRGTRGQASPQTAPPQTRVSTPERATATVDEEVPLEVKHRKRSRRR